MLCDYFKKSLKDRASFRIRYLTALEMAKSGNDVIFIYPETRFAFKSSQRIINSRNIITVIGTPGILPLKLRAGGFSIIDCIIKSIYVTTHDIDIIYVLDGHRPSSFIPCLIAKLFKKAKLINECWEWIGSGGYADIRKGILGKFLSFYDKNLELRAIKLFDLIIVITTALKKRFNKSKNVIVLHGGAENKKLFPYSTEEARKKLGLSNNLSIIGISNITRNDHDDNKIVFEALKKLCNQLPNVYLVLTGNDADYIHLLEDVYQLEGKIIFPGYVNFKTYNMYLSACDIFVLPFTDNNINRGRWPNKIGDYLCLKRPIITNPTGDIKKLFRSYQLGALCDETVESFFFTLKRFLENKNTIEYRSSDAEVLVNEVLSFEKRVKEILMIFTTIAKEKV